MDLAFTPQARLAPLHYAAAGDVLTVNGAAYDFGALTEGARLPRAAVSGDWLASPVTRTDGTLHLTVIAPNTSATPASAAAGVIDWSRAQTAEEWQAERVAAWRAQASVTAVDFTLAALAAGLVSAEDAEGWITGNAVPPIVEAALATIPDEGERTLARLRMRGATTVRRTSPFVALMAAHLGLTDVQVDALFGGPPA